MNHKHFTKLFEPGRIGSLELKNRLVMPPMATNYALKSGEVTQRQIDYYAERSKGGVGLVIVEVSCVDSPVGKGMGRQICIDDDKFIPGLSELAKAIKRHGAKAAIQLHHAGRQTSSKITGHQPVAPSPIPPSDGEKPRPLTLKAIQELIERFGLAAGRAKEAGFDGVEIHGAHGYLISQFLSALSNHRKDAYGGSVENRAKFLLDVIKAIRKEVGQQYPVWCRLSAMETGVDGGITVEETQVVAKLAEKAGVDAIHVSGHHVGPARRPPMAQLPCSFVPYAKAIKEVVKVPVIAVSRIPPELAEDVIHDGNADFISIGRQLLVDPYLPQKVQWGELEDIRPCLYCLTCLDSMNWSREGVRCVVNPTLGRERDSEIKRSRSPKKVVVVGGGPGGMEAARVAALRGHNVILFDEGEELGGQLILAAKPPFKDRIETFRRYLAGQINKLPIDLRLQKKFIPDMVKELNPDVVIVDTGVRPFIPQIPGIGSKKVMQASQVLMGAGTGERVAIIGGELVGCETALFLIERGKKVTIMRRGPELATKVHQFIREPMLSRLKYKGATILTGVDYQEITNTGIVIKTATGEKKVIEADTIVLAAGSLPDNKLETALKGRVDQVLAIGDCVEPRTIMEAVQEGYMAGLAI
jgi:2,4-dienoyl-CoA reductase-like NADH-dependent reductase (Old Yellow Enzyme family)/NADPH-dependent 2,4-dienoyl-CoA reductase/sulfur reductase-like enzyme